MTLSKKALLLLLGTSNAALAWLSLKALKEEPYDPSLGNTVVFGIVGAVLFWVFSFVLITAPIGLKIRK